MVSVAGHRSTSPGNYHEAPQPLLTVVSESHSHLVVGDFWSSERQRCYFALLNLCLIGALLALQAISKIIRGRPAGLVVVVLAVGFTAQAAQLAWLTLRRASSSDAEPVLLSFWFIGFNSLLSLVLTSITIRGDTAYYALMLLPILEAAFGLGLGAILSVIVLADAISFLGAYGMRFGEYIEAGAMSVIYTVMGLLVWLLVNDVQQHQARDAINLQRLEQARQQLLSEEKLAAVGRLSRALAHEIRNPVAMISSSLATARRAGQSPTVRQEMFEIAAKEAARLERLTTDFMAYARPPEPRLTKTLAADTLNYVATVARPHALRGGIDIRVVADANLSADFDVAQLQQALLNLVLNAIEACTSGDLVTLKAQILARNILEIDVVDPGAPIPADIVERLFEPLFTTKPGGNGLGLAIARNIVRAHHGDIVLTANEPGKVCFTIRIPVCSTPKQGAQQQ